MVFETVTIPVGSAAEIRQPLSSRPLPFSGALPTPETGDWHLPAIGAVHFPENQELLALPSASAAHTLQPATETPQPSPRDSRESPRRLQARCQVEGCKADLSVLREYHQRYKICEDHLKLHNLVRKGRRQRFCQQCGRFHELTEFDGEKRSCRVRLQRHNARRRKKAGSSSTQRAKVVSHKAKVQGRDTEDTEDDGNEKSPSAVAGTFQRSSRGRSDHQLPDTQNMIKGLQSYSRNRPFLSQAPASNQPLRSFLPSAGFAPSDVPLYLGKLLPEDAFVSSVSRPQQAHAYMSIISGLSDQLPHSL